MYIMTSRPRTRVSVQAPFGGVTDWYPEPGYKEPDSFDGHDSCLTHEAIPFGQPYHTHLNKAASLQIHYQSHASVHLVRLYVLESGTISSTFYPPTTSESSPDSSSKRSLDLSLPSTGPSRKRCRSPITLVPSSTHVSRSIAPDLADLPPRKRFRDSYSSEVNGEEHKEISIVDAETVADLGISEGVGAHTEDGIDLRVFEVDTSDIREDEEEFEAEAKEALAAYEATRAANALEAESQSQNGSDDDNGNGGNRNGGNGNSENGNPNENERSARPVAREYTYQDFMKCQPLNFKGMEGVVGLIRWFEKMETVFHISNYPEKYQVKYATCTLLIPT
ncbi:hypothetical protein Tco_1045700 [Tanacetum coccineum]|uniref:Reverse transcriptase domain-containing protein n=1 Tax=Tanacetum coccineum TaxID=301880 RepID=A0ABQ5GV40_9ASTR